MAASAPADVSVAAALEPAVPSAATNARNKASKRKSLPPGIEIVPYTDEEQLTLLIPLIEKDLSEPYSIYTYRYFLHNWPQLCYLVSF